MFDNVAMKLGATMLGLSLAMTAPAFAQGSPAPDAQAHAMAEPMTLFRPQEADFKPVPGAPTCLKLAGLRGDPSKEAATFMTLLDPGCVAPRHWHSATEETVLLSGTAVMHMEGKAPTRLPAGSYSLFPAHHVHRFKCLESAPCYTLTIADRAFDIHWVDRAGKEIGVDQAIAEAAKDKTPWDR